MESEFISGIVRCWSKYGTSYLQGAGRTLLISFVGTVIGCVIGFIVGLVQTIPVGPNDPLVKGIVLKIVKVILRVYVEVFRGTPMIVQAVFIYFGMRMLFGVGMGMWTSAFFIVSINTGAYMAETVRGGILSIDPGQTEGAKAIGMTHFQTMVHVILPQALRNIMPQIGNNFIINVKDTSVMFIIGFSEFFSVHKMVSGAVFKYFPSASIEMVGYLTMTLLASFLLRWVERKLDGADNYELLTDDQLVMTAGTYNHPAKGSPFDEKSTEFRDEMRGGR